MSPSPLLDPVMSTVPEGDWSNLEGFGGYGDPSWPGPQPAEPCVRTWKVAACECRTKIYESGCCRLCCRSCESHLRARRAGSFRDRIEPARRGKPLIYTIFTVPLYLRALAADPKVWSSWRRRIWKYLKKKHGGLFAVERTDPCGDSDERVWHPHLNFLWIQRDGFRPYLDVGALRQEWARIIGATGEVNAWTQYSSNDRKIGHWYWYLSRTWPDWQATAKKHMTVRWLGSYPTKPEKQKRCPDCGADFVSLDCGSKAQAEELAQLGPAKVRWEWEKIEIEKALRWAERNA